MDLRVTFHWETATSLPSLSNSAIGVSASSDEEDEAALGISLVNSREHSQSDETKPSTSTPGWLHYNISKLLGYKSIFGQTEVFCCSWGYSFSQSIIALVRVLQLTLHDNRLSSYCIAE